MNVIKKIFSSFNLGICTIIFTALLSQNCFLPTPPPSMSMAKLVKTRTEAADEKKEGAVSFSTGAFFLQDNEDDDAVLYSFPAEGAISFWGEQYDMAMIAGSHIGSYEANFKFINNTNFSLGFIHGLGFGFFQEFNSNNGGGESSNDGILFYNLSGGLLFQINTNDNSTAFAGLKYTYADRITSDSSESYKQTDFIMGSLGYTIDYGNGLKITPEITLGQLKYRYEEEDEYEEGNTKKENKFNYFVPGVSISATF